MEKTYLNVSLPEHTMPHPPADDYHFACDVLEDVREVVER